MLQPPMQPLALSVPQWVGLFAKEAFIGGAIGIFFSATMWAFESAGQLIDNKVGATQAQVTDPLSGHQTSLNGAFFARLASWVFMAGGGFMLMVGALLESYALWPVRRRCRPWPRRRAAVRERASAASCCSRCSCPRRRWCCCTWSRACSGSSTAFAQQLNVFSLSMSLKAVAATWIVWIQLARLMQLLQDDLMARAAR
jgi:type III secretion protein T